MSHIPLRPWDTFASPVGLDPAAWPTTELPRVGRAWPAPAAAPGSLSLGERSSEARRRRTAPGVVVAAWEGEDMRVAAAAAAVRADMGRGAVLAIGASSLHLAVQSATGAGRFRRRFGAIGGPTGWLGWSGVGAEG